MAKDKKEDEVINFEDESVDSEDPIPTEVQSAKKQTDDSSSSSEENSYEINEEMAMFAGVGAAEDGLYEDVEYDEDPENLHPAEVAARYQDESTHRGPVGGSDEQILKDLRKLVFSVPLLHQEEVFRLFVQIDQCVFPTVYSILEASGVYFEEVIQVVIKVSAGNTYGKNIYEKEDQDKTQPKPEYKGTFKSHEIDFLKNCYNFFRLFSANQDKPKFDRSLGTVEEAMGECAFIRGVYEDIIKDFVENTRHYDRLHWMALSAKLSGDLDEHHRIIEIIQTLDKRLKLNKSGFYIAREARRIYNRYTELRSQIIAPYLRSVYSAAKNTARNPHQMLDNFQNGSIGLMRAVSCYSTKRPASFASVAKWWIKQMMLLSIKEDANFVKLPVSTWQAFTQLEKARAKIGVGDENIEAIAKAAKMQTKKAKAVYHTIKIAQVYSLNRTYDSDEKLTLEDIMTNENRLGGQPDVQSTLLRDYCEEADLTDSEIKVLALRHGMLDLVNTDREEDEASLKEAVIQNLALLGFNYQFRESA